MNKKVSPKALKKVIKKYDTKVEKNLSKLNKVNKKNDTWVFVLIAFWIIAVIIGQFYTAYKSKHPVKDFNEKEVMEVVNQYRHV